MSCEWVYKCVFKSKYLNIAIIRSEPWCIKHKLDYKLPRILIETYSGGTWKQIGFLK